MSLVQSKNVKNELKKLGLPTNRRPTRPGEILLENFLKPAGITQKEFAETIGISYNILVNFILGRKKLTIDLALRLHKAFGNSINFWMNFQNDVDLYNLIKEKGIIRIFPYDKSR